MLKADPSIKVDSRAHKMSKSRGNVVNPDAVVREYGADALRLYEMFMGPLEATKPWSMTGVGGVRNFLDRVWRMIVDDQADDLKLDPTVIDVDMRRRSASHAAPNDQEGHRRHRVDEFQHRDCKDDGVHELLYASRPTPERGDENIFDFAGTVCATHLRRAMETVG